VSFNLALDEVYSIQHYAIKFVSDLWQVCGFSPGTLVSSTNKTERHDITEILLKVTSNTITLIPTLKFVMLVQKDKELCLKNLPITTKIGYRVMPIENHEKLGNYYVPYNSIFYQYSCLLI
jgi:hypothetical protein